MKDFFRNFLFVIYLLLIVAILSYLSGCSGYIKNLHDERFTGGMAVVNANAKLGAFNQEGNAEACKFVYSKPLSDKVCYKYDSGMCKIEYGCSDN